MIVYATNPNASDLVLQDAETGEEIKTWVQVDTYTGATIVRDFSRHPDKSGNTFFKLYPGKVRVYKKHYDRLCELTLPRWGSPPIKQRTPQEPTQKESHELD